MSVKIRFKLRELFRETYAAATSLREDETYAATPEAGPFEGQPGYRTTCGAWLHTADAELVENRLSQLVREVLCTGPDDPRTMGEMVPKLTETRLLTTHEDATISDEAWLAIPQYVRAGMTGNMLLSFVQGVPGA